ncbi:uncharacterized protein BP5553_00530 [Venustampulla echinocandica]|uniref:Rhodopsin domain-containing protein n=1 Tax=Venustampulla echinocandica TaxID=2656787 RepID=A0A370TYE9_9HELO|nr:uncharacterized protein BP5553_00530 [Venustampulla echinocandica]RDL40551.1 hypothetical protein BP5553_00530 [Venustampulla echinocandica]
MADGPPPLGPPPGPDVSIAGRLLAASIPLYILSISLYGMRIYTRIRTTARLGWDDAFVTGAMIAAISQWGILLACIPLGLGRHNYYVSFEDGKAAGRLLLMSQIPWGWAIALAKISIACMLLRIKQDRKWQIALYTMIAIQLSTAILANVVQLSQCSPLSATWDPTTPGAKCWPITTAQTTVYVIAGIGIVTDITFALLPISFLWKIQRPLREKLMLGFLMGIGLFTTVAVIVKIPLIATFGKTGDVLWDNVNVATWSLVEGQLGIIAACIPCLKSPFERLLRRVGLLSTTTGGISGRVSRRRTGYISYGDNQSYPLSSVNARAIGDGNKSSRNNDTQSEASILRQTDDASSGGKGNITKTIDIHVSDEPAQDRDSLKKEWGSV